MKTHPTIEIQISNTERMEGENPNVLTNQAMDAFRSSVKTFGQVVDQVVVDDCELEPERKARLNGKFLIINGEHTLQIHKEEGEASAQVKLVRCRNDAERRILRAILNGRYGKNDPEAQAQEYLKILKANEEKTLFALANIRETEFYNTLKMAAQDEPKDIVPDVPEEPITRPGDIWQMGDHRLICGDSCLPETYDKLMLPREKAHVVVTDPPYGIDYINKKDTKRTTTKWRAIKNDDLTENASQDFCAGFLRQMKENTTLDSAYYIFSEMKMIHYLIAALTEEKIYYALPLIWSKTYRLNAVFPSSTWDNYRPDYEVIVYAGEGAKNSTKRWYAKYDQNTTWNIKPDYNVDYQHPTQKPVELAERALLNSSREGETCLDLFAGSGFSLIACHKLKRIWRGIELENSYCDVIVKRWEHYAQTKATLTRDGKDITDEIDTKTP
jgi:DNA modification methylase